VTNRIDIIAPATISVLPGETSSLDSLPPGGISITDPNSATITVTLSAMDYGAAFSASSAGGATVSSSGATITITGLQAQVNAALASLTFNEGTASPPDTISITATDTTGFSSATDIAVTVASLIGPAFAAPPVTVSLSAYSLTTIGGLVLGDPQATALVAAGLGNTETMALTLAVASGILLLPSLSSLGGIQASGVGTGEIVFTFTADQLAAVNTMLAGLAYAAPDAVSGLAYAMRNIAGPLGGASTSGNIVLDITGTQGPTATVTSGADTAILGVSTLTGTLTIANTVSDLGGIQGAGAVVILPDAALELPYNTLSLSGTSYDFGTLGAAGLSEAGTLIIANGATIGGPLILGTAGFIDFSGTLITGANAQTLNQLGLSLSPGALVTGSGTLVAGNFSESGLISGGTILAGGGDTILLAAAGITGTALEIATGGVMVLGPLSPLYGVFNATPLTIAATDRLAFLDNSGDFPVTGGFADSLAQAGGVIVIDSPDVFSGTITGFAPGDRLIFPGLTGLTLLSVTSQSFVVAGQDSSNVTQSYTINAAYPSGTTPVVMADAAGDSEVALRAAAAEVFIDNVTASSNVIDAAAGIPQPILGLDVLLRSWTTQSLTLTLSVGQGVLADRTQPQAAALTITAASPTALNTTLASLIYTSNAGISSDTLTITSAAGLLAGLSDFTPILITSTGTVGGFGDEGQVAAFTAAGVNPPLTEVAAPGLIDVTGVEDFAGSLVVDGIGGTALQVDSGGTAIFDAAANADFGANIIIGDAAGAGQLDVMTSHFFAGGQVTIGAGGGAVFTGAATIAGNLIAGQSGAASVDISGALGAATVIIGALGSLTATGTADLGFDGLTLAGTASLLDQADLTIPDYVQTGTLNLGGTARVNAQNGTIQSGLLRIGPDAAFNAQAFTQTGGTISLAGTLADDAVLPEKGFISLTGGTLIAPFVSLAGGTIAGYGDIEGLGTISGGKIIATGALDIGDDVTAAISIATSAALDLVHGVSGTIRFLGGSAELTLNDIAAVTATITNMLDHDAIDIVGIAPSLVSFASGSISAGTLGGFGLSIASGQPVLRIAADGFGGTLLTLNGDMPCFARGTRLLTPNGYRPVETFSPGDPIITLGGAARAVRWIGWRTLDLAAEPRANPVLFAAGALGGGVPARPVRLSPLHAVFVDGVLVPALHLVNGATITQEPAGAATYYHLELDSHDIVLAEGMGTETYLDNGNRGALYHERGRRGICRKPCAALVTSGPQLAEIRRKLHGVALSAGYTLTYEPALRGVAGRRSVLPCVTKNGGRRMARFRLPAGAQRLHLAAQAAAPADTDPESEDRRRIAICLDDAGGGDFGAGWLPRAAGDSGVWMGGSGEILISRERFDITLGIAAIVRSWVPPIDLGGHPP
jgi:hypothetical protein